MEQEVVKREACLGNSQSVHGHVNEWRLDIGLVSRHLLGRVCGKRGSASSARNQTPDGGIRVGSLIFLLVGLVRSLPGTCRLWGRHLCLIVTSRDDESSKTNDDIMLSLCVGEGGLEPYVICLVSIHVAKEGLDYCQSGRRRLVSASLDLALPLAALCRDHYEYTRPDDTWAFLFLSAERSKYIYNLPEREQPRLAESLPAVLSLARCRPSSASSISSKSG